MYSNDVKNKKDNESFFLRDVLAIFSKSSWKKTEFFFGFSMKFCLEISYDLFFLDHYSGYKEKEGILNKKLKMV
jgi:hypothetical protein